MKIGKNAYTKSPDFGKDTVIKMERDNSRYQCKEICFYIEDHENVDQKQIKRCAERMNASGAEVSIFGTDGKKELKERIDQNKDTILLVTDDSVLIEASVNMQIPVLVMLHDGNQEYSCEGARYYIEGFDDVEYTYFDRVYCRCKQLPWTVMDTKQLRIREQTVADVEELYRIYAHPDITKYMEGLFPEKEQEKQYAEDYRKCVYEFFDFGIWVLEELATGRVIGRAGIEYKEELEENSAEMGFVIEQEKQGMGFGCEACMAIIQYAKEELALSKLFAFVKKENTASIRLLTKLNFLPDGGTLHSEDGLEEYMLVL